MVNQRTVSLFGKDYLLIQVDMDVLAILEAINHAHESEEWPYLLVKMDDSETFYAEVWGLYDTPYLRDTAYRLYPPEGAWSEPEDPNRDR